MRTVGEWARSCGSLQHELALSITARYAVPTPTAQPCWRTPPPPCARWTPTLRNEPVPSSGTSSTPRRSGAQRHPQTPRTPPRPRGNSPPSSRQPESSQRIRPPALAQRPADRPACFDEPSNPAPSWTTMSSNTVVILAHPVTIILNQRVGQHPASKDKDGERQAYVPR